VIEEYFPGDALGYFTAGDSGGLAEELDRLLRQPGRAERQAARAKQVADDLGWAGMRAGYAAALGLEQAA
jgi:hypothetical protein